MWHPSRQRLSTALKKCVQISIFQKILPLWNTGREMGFSQNTFSKKCRPTPDWFSRVEIHNALAGNVESVLNSEDVGKIDYVLSGIPFSFLKKDRKREVLQATKNILKDGGMFLAYQTSGHLKKPVMDVFGNYDTDFVPLNIPPYFIYKVYNNGSNGVDVIWKNQMKWNMELHHI